MVTKTTITNDTATSVFDWFYLRNRIGSTRSFFHGICSNSPVPPFPYYDPLLLRIFRAGVLVSLAGVGFGIGGVWRASPLRWHAPTSALATLVFWIMTASGE
jgi:hypothetical protein